MSPASRILQPSLVILLSVTAAILYSYGTVMNVAPERFAGMATGLAAILLSGIVIRKSIVRGDAFGSEWPPAPMPGPCDGAVSAKKRFPLRAFLLFVIAFATAALPAHRIRGIGFGRAGAQPIGSFIGTVEELRTRRYTAELTVSLHNQADAGRAVILAPYDCRAKRGDVVAVFSEPRFIDPESARATPYIAGLARRGISYIVYADDDSLSVVTSAPEGRREAVRSAIGRSIDRHFSAPTASLLRALYFGNKSHLDKRTIDSYKKAGVIHVLAASGLHVGIVAAVPFFLLAPFRVGKRIIMAVTAALLCFYLYITDMPVSLVRAFIMFALYAAQRFLDMDRGAVNTLFLAASAILAFAPHELYEPGFQLTFGATFGILLFFRPYEKSLGTLPGILRGPLALTLSAQVLVFPIIFHHMGEVNLVGPLSNLAVVPGITFALAASIASNCAGLLSETAGRLLALPVDCIVDITSVFVDAAASLGGHFRPDRAPWRIIPFFALYTLPLFAAREYRRPTAVAVLIAFAGAWTLLASDVRRSPGPRIVFRDGRELTVVSDGDHALVHGRISGLKTAVAVHEALERDGVSTVQLELHGTDYRSLSGAAFLARRRIISSCALDSRFRFSRALTALVTILDRDGIQPEFRHVPPPSQDGADSADRTALFRPPVRRSTLASLETAAIRFRDRIYAPLPGKGEPACDAVRGNRQDGR